jgi:hypothetical protein
VLATLSASRSDGLVDGGESAASALTSGYHLAFWIGAGLMGAAIVVALAVLRPQRAPKPQAKSQRTAARPAFSEG